MATTMKLLTAALLLGGMATTHAATLDTTSAAPTDDGVLQNFIGIDWHSNGGGWVQGYNVANVVGATDTFTFTYQAFAGVIQTTSPVNNLWVGAPGSQSGTYEMTTYAVIQETATCLSVGVGQCGAISIATTGGTWEIYFDTSPEANQATGTGFLDGALMLAGTWDSGFSVFGSNGLPPGGGGLGSGGGQLFGSVTYTNNTYVNPDLLGTNLQASLVFPGEPAPNYTRPAAFNGVPTGPDTATDFVLQTDTSQNFAVPLPGTLLLFGSGLLGLGTFRRRRHD